MKTRVITFGDQSYAFHTATNLTSQLGSLIDAERFDSLLVIADEGIPAEIRDKVLAALSSITKTHIVNIKGEEKHKNLLVVNAIAEHAINLGIDRRSAIVALGGGLVGNIAGIVAGMLFRGIPLIHIPTTFLGASDSVLSLKQAVNLTSGKNLTGFFYTPLMVCVDLDFFNTLPARHIRAGMAELVKNLLAIRPEDIARMKPLLRKSNQYTANELHEFLDFCIDAKMQVMIDDPYEKKHALVLEYGHTLGHALELVSNGALLHGECIAYGMLKAATICQTYGLLNAQEVTLHHELLDLIGIDIHPTDSQKQEILEFIQRDNKRGYVKSHPDKTAMVLLDGLGKINQPNNSFITLVDTSLIKDVLNINAFEETVC